MSEYRIGTVPLQEICDRYGRDLYDGFLPFMERVVIDHEMGGFMCHARPDGTRLSDQKLTWQQGRGIWIYSFLFQHLSHDSRHLATAAKAMEFVLSSRLTQGPPWPDLVSRRGEVLRNDPGICDALFLAEGLVGYSAASGERQYWDMAKDILLASLRFYDREDYSVETSFYLDLEAEFNPWVDHANDPRPRQLFKGARVQGMSMCLLQLATQMLRCRPDLEVESVASQEVRNVLDRYWNPAFNLNVEFLNHDYSMPGNQYSRFVYPGHTVQVMWMVMDEARRRGDEALFNLGAERFRRHVEVAWDDVYGGYFAGGENVEANIWELSKALWEQQEVLNGCLMLIEYRNDLWAHATYERTYRYIQAKFSGRLPESPLLYLFAGNRKVDCETSRFPLIDHYHHPRQLMLNLLACERLAGQGPSG